MLVQEPFPDDSIEGIAWRSLFPKEIRKNCAVTGRRVVPLKLRRLALSRKNSLDPCSQTSGDTGCAHYPRHSRILTKITVFAQDSRDHA